MSWGCIWVACFATGRLEWGPRMPVCNCHAMGAMGVFHVAQ